MELFGYFVSFTAIISGFTILILLGVQIHFFHSSGFQNIFFEGALSYFFFQLVLLINRFTRVGGFPQSMFKDVGFFFFMFLILAGYSRALFSLMVILLHKKDRPIYSIGRSIIPWYYLLLFCLSLFILKEETFYSTMNFFLWVPGGGLTQILGYVCAFMLILKRKKMDSPLIEKLINRFIIVFLISLPFQILEGVVYNFITWRLFPESFNFHTFFYGVFNILFLYCIAEHDINSRKNIAQSQKKMLLSEFSKVYTLTRREEEILALLIKDFNTNEISDKLYISPRTVEKHLSNIYKKCQCTGRESLMTMVQQEASNNKASHT